MNMTPSPRNWKWEPLELERPQSPVSWWGSWVNLFYFWFPISYHFWYIPLATHIIILIRHFFLENTTIDLSSLSPQASIDFSSSVLVTSLVSHLHHSHNVKPLRPNYWQVHHTRRILHGTRDVCFLLQHHCFKLRLLQLCTNPLLPVIIWSVKS